MAKTVTSPKRSLSREDLQKVGKNILLFVAPTLAIFFSQLAQGVDVKASGLVALLALYQALADLFRKWSNSNTYVVK